MGGRTTRTVRSLAFLLLTGTLFVAQGASLFASPFWDRYNTYWELTYGDDCDYSGFQFEEKITCNFPEGEFPNDPLTLGAYLRDDMDWICFDMCTDEEGPYVEYLEWAYGYPWWCFYTWDQYTYEISEDETWVHCKCQYWNWCNQ